MMAKMICDEYNIKQVKDVTNLFNFLFQEEYGVELYRNFDYYYLSEATTNEFKIFESNTIYNAIINDDIKSFIAITEI